MFDKNLQLSPRLPAVAPRDLGQTAIQRQKVQEFDSLLGEIGADETEDDDTGIAVLPAEPILVEPEAVIDAELYSSGGK